MASVTRECSAVTGACLAVRREVFEELDGFDEGLGVDLNDVDFCLRARGTPGTAPSTNRQLSSCTTNRRAEGQPVELATSSPSSTAGNTAFATEIATSILI